MSCKFNIAIALSDVAISIIYVVVF